MLLATTAFDHCPALPGIRVSSTPSDARARSYRDSPASLLGKRDVEGSTKRPSSNSRTASRFRGVTHHCRTSRFESHIWEEGKQVYLGGFYVEEQAAMAYDLAAIRFRGSDATTNFELETYPELQDAELVSREQVVHCLRDQSKSMNRLDTHGSISGPQIIPFEPWELCISEFIQQDKWAHLGVFGGEVEAARAYDRAVIQRKGVEALTNFPLVDYVNMLDVTQVEEAIARGLLPPTLPSDFVPSPAPLPLYTAMQPPVPTLLPPLATTANQNEDQRGQATRSDGSHGSRSKNEACHSGGETPAVGAAIRFEGGQHSMTAAAAAHDSLAAAAPAPTAAAAVPAVKMITPRSVMDFQLLLAQTFHHEEQRRDQLKEQEAVCPGLQLQQGM